MKKALFKSRFFKTFLDIIKCVLINIFPPRMFYVYKNYTLNRFLKVMTIYIVAIIKYKFNMIIIPNEERIKDKGDNDNEKGISITS